MSSDQTTSAAADRDGHASPRAEEPQRGPLPQLLDRLWTELPVLRQTVLSSEESLNRLADHLGALRFLEHSAADRPLLAGFVGGASCGKSTLFDSLIGQTISHIHYQPHSSLGPIMWAHRGFQHLLFPEATVRRWLPQLNARPHDEPDRPDRGAVEHVTVVFHENPSWGRLALLDLPDISSESSRREGWLVHRLLPWLDLVVWMVDPNDYLFEDLYVDPIDQVCALGQCAVVVVNDIHGQIGADRSVLEERIAKFRPEASFILPQLVCRQSDPYPLFQRDAQFQQLKRYLLEFDRARPAEPLRAYVRQELRRVIRQNAEWDHLVQQLRTFLTRTAEPYRQRILSAAPLLSVLPESAQAELERLRNRLSLLHHGKRLLRFLHSPADAIRRPARGDGTITVDELDTGPLYRYLLGQLKGLDVALHQRYLTSDFVQRLRQERPERPVCGAFDPQTMDFQSDLDQVARRLFDNCQQILSDPSFLNDPQFRFAGGATSVALAFFLVESMLGIPGVTVLVGATVTSLVGIISPELAKLLPIDRMSRLAAEGRDSLTAVLDRQIHRMVAYYSDAQQTYLEPGNQTLDVLNEVTAALMPKSRADG